MKNCNIKRSELPSIFQQIQTHCGYQFQDLSLLQEALTHASYAAEQSPMPASNQRLEFLGDAVLQIVLSEYLFARMPQAKEGLLTKMRSLLANESATAEYTRQLRLDVALLLGKGEMRNGGRQRQSIQADLYEAFLGAVDLDGGLPAARQLCLSLLPDLQKCLDKLAFGSNPKGALQEYCQRNFQAKPTYEHHASSGPDHQQIFEVKVCLGEKTLAQGTGSNKHRAEEDAANKALHFLINQPDAPPLPKYFDPEEVKLKELDV